MRRCADWSQGGGCSTLVDWNGCRVERANAGTDSLRPAPSGGRLGLSQHPALKTVPRGACDLYPFGGRAKQVDHKFRAGLVKSLEAGVREFTWNKIRQRAYYIEHGCS